MLILAQLGSAYNLDDLNWMVASGLRLGARAFTVPEVTAITYQHFHGNARDNWTDRVTMPAGNYRAFNFLDALVLIIGSLEDSATANDRSIRIALANKSDFLCSFAHHATANFGATFDHLRYLLVNRHDFRPARLTYLKQSHSPSFVPTDACLNLIASLAANHQNINPIIDDFAAAGNIEMATWLTSLAPQAAATTRTQSAPAPVFPSEVQAQ